MSDSLQSHELAAHQASLSFTIWSLLKPMSIELVMPSNYLIFRCPLLLPSVFPSVRVFSIELSLCIRWPKYWSFIFSNSPFNEYSGLISFRIDWFDFFQSKVLSRVFSSTTVWKYCSSPILIYPMLTNIRMLNFLHLTHILRKIFFHFIMWRTLYNFPTTR